MTKNIKKTKYTKSEKQIVDYAEKASTKRKAPKQEIEKYQNIFGKNSQNRKMISLRVPEEDLKNVKLIAKRDGIPYQTLINSVLHKFINGQLATK
jgi:predicted DNA binding CopG/RHH family protein